MSGGTSTTAARERAPGAADYLITAAGLGLGVWLSLRNDADAGSLLVTGVAGLLVGTAAGWLRRPLSAIALLVAFFVGLLVHVKYAGSVAPLWPFALFAGFTVSHAVRTAQRGARRRSA